MIKNLDKAAKRILKAIEKQERIIVYGDSDLDGVASVIILEEALKNLGAENTSVYFPDREQEGYGINEKALLALKQYAPCLLVSVDLGIGNYKEVEKARKMKFSVIIIDHHEILDKIPKADIVVDPKQKGDKHAFKQLAAAGLVFKLSENLFNNKMPESLKKNFLELAAMATIADMMPKEEDNALIISEGLNYLKSTWRPGIQELFKAFQDLELSQRIYKVNSLLNVRDVENGLPSSYRVLASDNNEKAKALVERLLEKSLKRKELIQEILEQIEDDDHFIFQGAKAKDWDIALLGVVASLAVKKYQKPVFLFCQLEGETMGSIRAPSGYNVVLAMKGFAKNLITYGGHPQAAGFRIKNGNLEAFKKHLAKYYEKNNNIH